MLESLSEEELKSLENIIKEAIRLGYIHIPGGLMTLEKLPNSSIIQNFGFFLCNMREMALGFVPEDKRTAELCLAAVKQDGRCSSICTKQINYSEEIYLDAVRKHGFALKLLPIC